MLDMMRRILLAGRRGGLVSMLLLVTMALVVIAASRGAVAQQAAPEGGNRLANRSPVTDTGVSRPGRLTDGQGAVEGDPWQTDLTSVFATSRAHVVWDLGASVPICCATIQGDANDRYSLSVSDDGATWKRLWEAGPVRGGGMLTRDVSGLDATGRFVRLSASGGDGRYSVAEVQLFSHKPAGWPVRPPALQGKVLTEQVHVWIQMLVVASIAFLVIRRRNSPRWMTWAGLIPVGIGAYVAVLMAELWPLDESEQTLVRAAVAAIAGAVVLVEYFIVTKRKSATGA
jgi:hypothetical protein